MKVLLLGYYGFGNFGDEWSLAEVAAAIREVLPAAELTVISGDPEATELLHGLVAVKRTPQQIRRAIKECDLVVCGGGSLLQDVTSSRSLLYYLSLLWYAIRNNKRIILWGQGLGPLIRREHYPLVKKVLDQTCLITLRDRNSYALLQEVGVAKPVICVTADPTFSGYLFAPRSQESTEPVLTLVVREWPGKGHQWLDSIAAAIAGYCQARHWEVMLCLLQPDHDRALAAELQAKLASLGIAASLAPPWQRLEDVAEIFASSSLIVAGRYHALALAAVLGVPAVGIGYDPKVAALGSLLNLPVLVWEDLQDRERTRQALEAGGRVEPEVLHALAAAARRTQEVFAEIILGETRGE